MVVRTPKDIDYSKVKIDSSPLWSPSRIKVADSCMRMYLFNYVLHLEDRQTVSALRGDVLHGLLKGFWKNRGGVWAPYFKEEDSFANTAVNRVGFQAKREFCEGKDTPDLEYWKTKSEKFKEETREMARIIYRRYLEEGPCLNSEGELFPTEFNIKRNLIWEQNGQKRLIKLNANIDELRRNLVVRDHKTGYKSLSQEFLDRDIQFTHYLLSLFAELQHRDSSLMPFLGDYYDLSLEEFLREASIEVHHVPALLKLEEKDRPEKSLVYSSKRSVAQVNDLVKRICAAEDDLKKRNFYATCDTGVCKYRCSFNDRCDLFDVEDILARAFNEQNTLFTFSGLEREAGRGCVLPKEDVHKPKQKVIRWMKKENVLKL